MHDCPKQAAGETLFLLIFQLTSFSPVSWWKLCLSYLLLVTSLTLCSNMVIRIWVTKSASWQIIARHTYRKFLCVATDLVVGTIMDPVSVAFHTSKGLQLNIVDIKILHILYFILCRYGQICGRIIASEVQNNGYLQARYFNIPLNLAGGTRVFFCIVPTRIYILLLYICKYCCSQHVWGYHLCSCRNT